jgi:hypothetical protein
MKITQFLLRRRRESESLAIFGRTFKMMWIMQRLHVSTVQRSLKLLLRHRLYDIILKSNTKFLSKQLRLQFHYIIFVLTLF